MDSTKRMSGELFNILTTSLEGEPLQTLYNCNFNGLEAWRRLSKRYSPTTPLRAMQLMLQISRPEKTKDLEHVQTHIDRWESTILTVGRDSDEQLSERIEGSDPHLDAPLRAERRHLAEFGQLCGVPADQGASHHYATRTARRDCRRSEKEVCTATDAEDKGISQQNVERLSRRRLKERLDLRETAKARVQEREKGRWIGSVSASAAARGATALGTAGPGSEMKPEEKEVKEQVLRPWRTREAPTMASARTTGSTSRRWARTRRTSGRRSSVDAHVRAVHDYRNPPRPLSKASTWWMGLA